MRSRSYNHWGHVVLVVVCSLFTPLVPLMHADAASSVELMENRTAHLVNVYRTVHGLPELIVDPTLAAAADAKASDMAARGYFAHAASPDESVWQSLSSFDNRYTTAAENLSLGYDTPEKIVAAWADSPSHTSAMIGDAYTRIGIGSAERITNGTAERIVVAYLADGDPTQPVVRLSRIWTPQTAQTDIVPTSWVAVLWSRICRLLQLA